MLEGAGEAGTTQERLLEVAGYGGASPDSQRRMLTKDITYLNRSGWDIQNVAGAGTEGRYVLHLDRLGRSLDQVRAGTVG